MDSKPTRRLAILADPYSLALSLPMEPNLSSRKYVDPISHDGIRDCLTQLSSPKFFYDSLTRECARSDRELSPLVAVRFRLEEITRGDSKDQRISNYEIAVINFSKVLNSYSRSSDLSARMARFEFISLLACAESDAEVFISRVRDGYRNQGFITITSLILRLPQEKPLLLLNRLDQAPEVIYY